MEGAVGLRVKICGCRRPGDAIAAAEAGASYVGVVFAERTRRVTPARAAEILAPVRSVVRGVGVFVDASRDRVLAARDVAGFEVAQLHGLEPPERCAALRGDGLGVWKAIRPRSAEELARQVDRYREVVDGVLVEGFSRAAAGGTGTGFPHSWMAPVRDRFSPGGPVLVLAGGLTPENVAAAIEAVRPAVVDVSSGVERAPGEKDPARIRRFVDAAAGAALAGRERPVERSRGGGP